MSFTKRSGNVKNSRERLLLIAPSVFVTKKVFLNWISLFHRTLTPNNNQ